MWIIYTDPQDRDFPMEVGYRVIESARISHDYDRITGYCQDGCPDYGSGGCPPHAPAWSEVAAIHPHGILIYAKFLSRFKPSYLAADDFSLQDTVLSDFLNQLGYAILAEYEGDLFFVTCGHCQGCGEESCSYKQGEASCRRPERRAYSIAAAGVDVTPTLKNVFDIDLQWIKGENQAEYIIKVMGLFSADADLPMLIASQLSVVLNKLACLKWKLDSPEARKTLHAAQIKSELEK